MPEGWTPLIGPQRYDSDVPDYDYLRPTLGQSAAAESARMLWDQGPIGSLYRMGEMDRALGQGVFGTGIGATPPSQRAMVGEEQWKASSDYRPGLAWHEGLTAEAARLLAERHDTRAKRDDVLNRTYGVATNTVVKAAGFAAAMADPLNVASAFIPIVGEARFARLLAQLGRPGARVATGAIEGTVGTAITEPLIYAAAQQDQLDYSMADSLISVGEGAVGGAILHAGLGALGDVYRRLRGPVPAKGEAHTAAADTAIRQAAADAEIEVRPVLQAAPRPIVDPRVTVKAADLPSGERIYTASAEGRAIATAHIDGDTVRVDAPLAPRQLRELVSAVRQDNPEARWLSHAGAEPVRLGVVDPFEARRTAEREAVARDREVIRRGRQEDALRPRTPAQKRTDAHEDLLAAYPSREIALPSGRSVTRKGPMDLATYVRASGGIQDAPELRDLNRKARSTEFAKGEGFIGALVSKEGLPLEEMARRAAVAGYIGRTEEGVLGVESHATVDEFVQALHQTIAAGDDLVGRVWGIGDEDQPVHDYIATMRGLDEEEAFSGADAERYQPLTDEDFAADEGAFGDTGEAFDDPEKLWQEEMARMGEPPEEPGAAKPRAEGEPAPLTPEQQIELDAERYRSGVAAAASCVARAI